MHKIEFTCPGDRLLIFGKLYIIKMAQFYQLGIDLRALSRYAGDQNTRIIDMNKADIARFKLK